MQDAVGDETQSIKTQNLPGKPVSPIGAFSCIFGLFTPLVTCHDDMLSRHAMMTCYDDMLVEVDNGDMLQWHAMMTCYFPFLTEILIFLEEKRPSGHSF